MRFSSFQVPVCLLALASYAAAEGTEEAKDKDILKLTAKTFDEAVSDKPLMLVEFFAPWCGHCKALAPEYADAATTLKDKNIVLASVDCVDQAELCQTHGVQGYPTLKVYRNGTPSDYSGPRKADGIVSYMVKQSLPAVSEVTAANFEEFKAADKFVAIAYLPSTTSEPAAAFSAIAEKHRDDYLFGLVTDEEATKAAGVKAPAVVVYRKFDEPQVEYPYPLTSAKEQDFEEWFSELSVPIMDEVGPENYHSYASSSKPLAYLFLDPTSEDKDAQIAAIKPIAAKYKSKMNFVWIDGIKFGDHGKALNLAESKWPSFVIQNLEKQLKYPYDQSKEVTPDAVDDLVSKYLDGKLEPTLKSQPIPETQTEAAYTVVGKNFDEVVLDESKDVFVEFYATWCGHCKRLAPTWESLAEKYAPVKDKLTIAKMEATENDLPPSVNFKISGFPTLKFKPAGSKDFVDYEGDRSIESLVEFVEKNAKNSIELPKVETPKEEDAQAPLTPEATPEAERHDEL